MNRRSALALIILTIFMAQTNFATAEQNPNIGRYQISVIGDHAYVLDTVTGRVTLEYAEVIGIWHPATTYDEASYSEYINELKKQTANR